MSIDALGLHLGPIYLRFYGIILVSGAMIGAYVASVEAQRRGLDSNYVWDALIWALVGGIVGARLYHVFTPPPSMVAAGFTTEAYFAQPWKILEVWNGGLGIPGGLVGGVLGMWLFTLKNKLNFPVWLDLAAPGIAIAQAIGRWGNFVNNELYGQPTNLPWGVFIPEAYRLPAYAQFERFHPIFLYESILNLACCLILLYIARRYAESLRAGDVFLIYLIIYPAIRFLIEFIRLDSSGLGNLNINQTLSAAVALVSILALAIRHRRQRRVRPAAPAAPTAPAV
jgi:phosphatidylglycerol---prolipoprotein diacylglyceryl transferase